MLSLWTRSLQKQLSANELAPVTVISVHPGGVDTFTQNWVFPHFFKWMVGLVIAQPDVGAYNSVFAAASKRVHENRSMYRGAYLESQPTGRVAAPNPVVLDEALAERLQRTTEDFLERIGA